MRKLILSAAVAALVAPPGLAAAQDAESKAPEEPGLLSQIGSTVGGMAATTAGAAAGGPLGGAAAGLAGQKVGGSLGGFVGKIFKKKKPKTEDAPQAAAPAQPEAHVPYLELPAASASAAAADAAAEEPVELPIAPPG